ncbi:glyoxalase/bleomycin resistance/extradiol dioxygenase family protein [Solihabitans fulvus]|uniref:Glyoxalase/bleomycin resistance/extradiol dioxygenase family protein n=1 Tax=Solihabitans fulvus TaxID=1892852 RepID=A0A5B2X7G2_9PSEU|nr:VOC family protein [Solihabitans fulvus]KAA2258822.1 glyoxalase/bleomycin resistance/extradiol dioxygenase family protein [Solihabitans fulvus]
MDAIYPRLLVSRFAECVRFYRDQLGFEPTKVIGDYYANFDIADEAAFVLIDRGFLARTVGTDGLPADAPAQDRTMLVLRVDDVDARLAALRAHGVEVVVEATDRPEWGPNIRTAHLRDPDGNLVELQSY